MRKMPFILAFMRGLLFQFESETLCSLLRSGSLLHCVPRLGLMEGESKGAPESPKAKSSSGSKHKSKSKEKSAPKTSTPSTPSLPAPASPSPSVSLLSERLTPFIFAPPPAPPAHPNYCTVQTSDGNSLFCYHIRPQPSKLRPLTLVFFHGNGEVIEVPPSS